MNDEIQHILSGKSQVKYGSFIQTIISHLTRSQAASAMAKGDKYFRAEETKTLIQFIDTKKLW